MDIFEQATRQKLRFDTPKGQITVEDLWSLPLQGKTGPNLYEIATDLNKRLKDTSDVPSFLQVESKTSDADNRLQLQYDIVKRVVEVKHTENAAALASRVNAEKKQQLLGLIAQKQNEQLAGKSLDDLVAMVNALPS